MEKNYKVNFNDYSFMDEEGTYTGTIVYKLYGKRSNILAYINLDNGHKIIAVAYQKPYDYLGLKEIEVDSRVEAAFERTKRGLVRLKEINTISE